MANLDNNIEKVLAPREIEILKYRYGLFGAKECTQNELAELINTSFDTQVLIKENISDISSNDDIHDISEEIEVKIFKKPNNIFPFSNIRIVSSEKVENEVKPPNIPTAKKL